MRLLSRLVIVIGVCLGLSGLPLRAAPLLLADLDTGRVIYSDDATQLWHPASVTKLMTVYLAFKSVQAGRIKWTTPLVTSERAKAMPPSKIGMKVGQTLTLDAAVKILLVKSANDIAVIVAESLGGSVEGFAGMMNREAAAIGMVDSHFVNPHGLFAEGQKTTARDMAILARRITLDFPKLNNLFGLPAIQIGDKVMENTNGIIGRYGWRNRHENRLYLRLRFQCRGDRPTRQQTLDCGGVRHAFGGRADPENHGIVRSRVRTLDAGADAGLFAAPSGVRAARSARGDLRPQGHRRDGCRHGRAKPARLPFRASRSATA